MSSERTAAAKTGMVTQVTSVHSPFDTRIFGRMCRTLTNCGYTVTLIARHDRDETVAGVRIRSLPEPRNRIDRMTRVVLRALVAAFASKGSVYHLHDPELMPMGILLRLCGKRVVYDAHEDFPRQILAKYWIPPWLRSSVSGIAEFAERLAVAFAFDRVVTATEWIAERFPARKTTVIRNFPLPDEFATNGATPYRERPLVVAYAGHLSALRGGAEMVEAIGRVPGEAELHIAGTLTPASLATSLRALPAWHRVRYVGPQSRDGIVRLLEKARMGLVVFHPGPNHDKSQPNKLFEYMAAGIPVVASDFPLWRNVVERVGCGLLVNPLDSGAIASAIQWLLEHPEEAATMGRRGQEAIREDYNWSIESRKLVDLYATLLK